MTVFEDALLRLMIYNYLLFCPDVGWVGGGCDTFDWDWVVEHGCTPGDCPYSFTDFRAEVSFLFT